ncbi:11989_t:CDS:1, partial [Racocetra fulgida]
DGSLHDYLNKNFKLIRWNQKLDILYTAIKGLSEIHEENLMHKDFHAGNIIIHEEKLMHKDFHAGNIIIPRKVSFIADFGLCKN